jgi:hypothetical protein
MKGVVFTELLEMVEAQFGMEIADQIIESADLPSGGAYTAVGTYDYHEVLQLVSQLSQAVAVDPATLVQAFGQHLFGRLAAAYPMLFEGIEDTQALLLRVDDFIHVEVHKLYPEAELPKVLARSLPHGQLEVSYSSTRPFADLAEGLIRGCAAHFQEAILLEREDLSDPPGTAARFVVSMQAKGATCLS